MRIVLLSVLLFVLAACSGSKEPREAQPLDACQPLLQIM